MADWYQTRVHGSKVQAELLALARIDDESGHSGVRGGFLPGT